MKHTLYLLWLLAWAWLATPPALAQTCTATSTLNYSAVATGSRKTSSDAVASTTVNYGGFTAPAGTTASQNLFTVGQSDLLSPNNVLVWSQNDKGLNPTVTANTSTVTLTFSRDVTNLQLRLLDIDSDPTGANGSVFTDRLTFDGYATATGGLPITLTGSNVVVSTNNTNRFVGSGYTGSSPAPKNNAVTGIANNDASATSLVTVTFPGTVRRVLTYENIAAYTNANQDRLQLVSITQMSWCRATPVAADVTTATIPSAAGQNSISPLSATAPEGTVASYRVLTVPSATTQGTLYYNSAGTTYTAITGAIALTPAQAASLRYEPLNAASGNATFTYSATDNGGAVSNTATYTLPVVNSVCATATATLNFSARPAGEDWKAHAPVAVPAASALTTVGSGGYTVPASATVNTLQVGTVNGVGSLLWNLDYASQTQNSSSVTFTFNRPVSGLAVRVQDIDRAENSTNAFIDEVTFGGDNGGTAVVPVLGPAAGSANSNTVSISGNVATGTTSNTSANGATVLAYFASPVTSVTLTYRNTSTYATNPTGQAVGIDLLQWCRALPVANNVATAPVANTAGAVAVPGLSASTDGSVQYYTLSTLPAQGTLYVNGTPATQGQQLTAAQANQLTYMPVAGFSGNVPFTYTVTDEVNATSATAATYTVPVTAAGGAGTPAPCASPGKDNSLTTTGSTGVLNTYYPGAASVAAGSTQLTLGARRGSATPLAANDLVLIIQMQGADFDNSNTSSYGTGQAGTPVNGSILNGNNLAGQYEYAQVAAVSGNTITLASALVNGYAAAPASAGSGQRTFQVVRVPQYLNLTLGANLLPSAWNGQTGGIVALDVAGQLSLGGYAINASGAGFRGGAGRTLGGDNTNTASTTDYRSSAALNVHATKSEGTAGTPRYVSDPAYSATTPLDTRTATTNYPTLLAPGLADGYPGGDNARGAPGNAGGGGSDGDVAGNSQNSGGGGGANGGAGGRGGNTWNGNQPVGGEPGAAFVSASTSRLVMGGGGGAGSTNNGTGDNGNTGFASSGGNGGGLVLVRTGTLASPAGSSIAASGSAPAGTPANDGAGGGGTGGSILLTVNGSTAPLTGLTLTATGGNGGSNTPGANDPHGPGGGGIVFTNGTAANSSSVAAGTNGTNSNNNAFNAAPGATGTRSGTVNRQVASSVAGASCLVDVAASLTGPTSLSAGQPTGPYTATFSNVSLNDAATVTQRVALPAGATLTTDQRTALNARYGLTAASYSTTSSGATAVTTIDFGTTATLAVGAPGGRAGLPPR